MHLSNALQRNKRLISTAEHHAGQVAVSFGKIVRLEHFARMAMAAEVAVDAENNVTQMFNKM